MRGLGKAGRGKGPAAAGSGVDRTAFRRLEFASRGKGEQQETFNGRTVKTRGGR